MCCRYALITEKRKNLNTYWPQTLYPPSPSVRLYSTFYLLFFFYKVTFSFSCTCYMLNTLKRSSNHSEYKTFEVFHSVLYARKNTLDVTTLHYISSLTQILAKSEFSTLLRDFT